MGGICFKELIIMLTLIEIKQLIRENKTHDFYNDWDWRKLSHEVIEENNNECYICKQNGKYSRAVLVHHVRHLKKYPELAYSRTYEEKNKEYMQLMPLCHNCHEQIHQRGIYAEPKGFTNQEKW